MKDAMSSEEFRAGSAIIENQQGVGGVMSGATLQVSESIGTAEIDDAAVTAQKQGFLKTGSPLALGAAIEVGSLAVGGFGSEWHVFETAYLASPNVVIGPLSVGSAGIGSVAITTVGSFLAGGLGSGITPVVSFIAAGSGQN